MHVRNQKGCQVPPATCEIQGAGLPIPDWENLSDLERKPGRDKDLVKYNAVEAAFRKSPISCMRIDLHAVVASLDIRAVAGELVMKFP